MGTRERLERIREAAKRLRADVEARRARVVQEAREVPPEITGIRAIPWDVLR